MLSFLQHTKLSEAHIFDERQQRGFFPKPSAAKLLILNLSTVGSPAISGPAPIRNKTPTELSEGRSASPRDALLHQGLNAGRESSQINV